MLRCVSVITADKARRLDMANRDECARARTVIAWMLLLGAALLAAEAATAQPAADAPSIAASAPVPGKSREELERDKLNAEIQKLT
jgi:hypothetical protein